MLQKVLVRSALCKGIIRKHVGAGRMFSTTSGGSFLSPKDFLDSVPMAAAGTSITTAVSTPPAPATSVVATTVTTVSTPAYQPIRLGVQLSKYATNLTKMAADGELEKVIGREDEIQQAIQILSRRRKNNPCLIGEPGVGMFHICGSVGRSFTYDPQFPAFIRQDSHRRRLGDAHH